MTRESNKTKLSPRAWILIGLLVILFPLSNILSYQIGELDGDIEGVSLRVDLLACETRITEAMSQCITDEVRRQHVESDYELADPARFGEGE